MVAYELPSTVFALVVLFAIDFFAILLYTGTVTGGTGQLYLYLHNLKYNICPECHLLLFRFSILFETPPINEFDHYLRGRKKRQPCE